MQINYLEFLLIMSLVFVMSFYFTFHNERFVNQLIERKKLNMRSHGYSEEQINRQNAGDWYMFYKLAGIFGLTVTSIGILVSLKHIFFG